MSARRPGPRRCPPPSQGPFPPARRSGSPGSPDCPRRRKPTGSTCHKQVRRRSRRDLLLHIVQRSECFRSGGALAAGASVAAPPWRRRTRPTESVVRNVSGGQVLPGGRKGRLVAEVV